MTKRKSRSKRASSTLGLRSFDATPQQEIKTGALPTPERAAKGRFVREPIFAVMTDSKGERRGPKYVESYRRRDADLDMKQLGRRFPGLTQLQVQAAVLLEQDHEEAQLEPRLVANMEGGGGGGGRAQSFDYGTLQREVIDARNRVHDALNFMRLAGPKTLSVVEAIVLRGLTTQAAGAERYARDRDAVTWATAKLEAGLSLLAAHYVKEGRLTERDEAA